MTGHETTPAIRAVGLRRSYGKHLVLDGIDLEVAAGTVFALLGPNGAGKTTTVHILSTLIPADGGEVQVAGHDVRHDPHGVRAAIGVTGQFSAVDGLLTGEENLILMADLRHLGKREGRRRAAELLDRFDLVEAAKKPLATFSGGMRRRLDLAMTLVGDPRIIFLDEPTAGLDPRSRRVMWQIVRDLVAGGVTIFLTTQYLEEADRLANRIAVLDGGKIVAEGTPDELKRLVPGGHVRLEFADPAELDKAARTFDGATRDDEALTLQVPSDGGVGSLRSLLDRLDEASIEVGGLSVQTAGPRRRLPVSHQPRRQPKGSRAMTPFSNDLTDTATMLRRNLRHMRRYPMLFFIAGIPVVLLLLFVFVFGGTLGAGLGGLAGGRAEYVAYVTPGILLFTVAGGCPGDGDRGCDGHERGDRRPLPDDADLAGLGPDRPRAGQHDPDDGGRRDRQQRRGAHRVPAHHGSARVGRRSWPARPDRAGNHLGLRGPGPGEQERRDREQPADAADAPALLRERVRPHRLDAGAVALVRRQPAVHPDHRDRAALAPRRRDRQQRTDRRRLVRRDHARRISLGKPAVRPPSCTLGSERDVESVCTRRIAAVDEHRLLSIDADIAQR